MLSSYIYPVMSQQYPVQVTTTLVPPYSVYLSDYTSPESNSLQVMVNLLELDRTNLQIKLRITIEGAGITLRTSASYVPPPINIQGGVPIVLLGSDLRPYFNPDNLDFTGITRSKFLQLGRLPEGFYTFHLEVLEYNRSVRVSNVSMANAWIMLNDPPLINTPFKGDKLIASDPQNIMFSWTPRHMASPNAAFSTEYEFRLVELYPGQDNPEVAIRSSNSIYTTTTSLTALNYGVIEPTLIPGKSYAFRIRAYDTSGRDLFKNQGYSETHVFQYGDACLAPNEINAKALDPQRARISWEAANGHTGFDISYRLKGRNDWYEQGTTANSRILTDLAGETTYEYRVTPLCGTITGSASPVLTFTTPEINESGFVCGAPVPEFDASPTPLMKPLLPLDMIRVGDWSVSLINVQANGDGSYAGMGYAAVPSFNLANVRVAFDRILVNEDYQVIAGDIKTVYTGDSKFVLDITPEPEVVPETVSEEPTDEALPTEDLVADVLNVTVPAAIGEVVFSGGLLKVYDESGNLMEGADLDLPPEGEEMTITDENGDVWVVDGAGGVSGGSILPDNTTANGNTATDSVQYVLPFTVYVKDDYYLVDPDKTQFVNADTITVESHMAGITLLIKDAEGKPVELLSSHFPFNAGEIWPPGFIVDIEKLDEGEIEEVKILISEVDTLMIYIMKQQLIQEMSQSNILALLSDIREAHKNDQTTCNLSERLTSYGTEDIVGYLSKVKVNKKYEVQSLKLKITNQGNYEILLEDIDITLEEGTDKDNEKAVFTFTETKNDKTVLELTVEKKDREFLEWYLLGEKPVFKITTTYIEDDDYSTVSSFIVNRGNFSGYFLERSEGTAAEERTAGSGKRIPEGDYEMCYTYKSCRDETTRSNADNETWIKTNGETDNSGVTITREYILIHIGNYPWNMTGCLLIGSSHSDFTLDKDYDQLETGETFEQDWVVNMVSSSETKLTALNNEYKKLIDLTKIFDDDCENNKCYELEIDINH